MTPTVKVTVTVKVKPKSKPKPKAKVIQPTPVLDPVMNTQQTRHSDATLTQQHGGLTVTLR